LPRARPVSAGRAQERAAAVLRTIVGVEGRAPAAVFSLPQFLARGTTVDAVAQQAVTPEDICYIL